MGLCVPPGKELAAGVLYCTSWGCSVREQELCLCCEEKSADLLLYFLPCNYCLVKKEQALIESEDIARKYAYF